MDSKIIEDFRSFALKNQAINNQLKELKDQESFVSVFVEMGQKNGYNFSKEDVNAYILAKTSSGELSEQELNTVSGGTMIKGACVNCSWTCGSAL